MAIFIASTKSISRGKGQSAVASASYRAGEKLQDDRYGKSHDYSKRDGVMSANIILPSSLENQNINVGRGELWNLAESSEKRKDARVAREWLVNLPHELDEETRKTLAHDFSKKLADRYNVIADCAIHRPTNKEIAKGADYRNYHAHILLTTRKAVVSSDGKLSLGEKSQAELSDKKRKDLGLGRMKAEITEIRELWEQTANEYLLANDFDLIDSRSYKSQGIDILPQLKMGKDATQLERRKGEKTDKGIINDLIKQRNELVFTRELKDVEEAQEKADQIIADAKKLRLENEKQKYLEDGKARAKAQHETWKREQEKEPKATNTNSLQDKFAKWKADRANTPTTTETEPTPTPTPTYRGRKP